MPKQRRTAVIFWLAITAFAIFGLVWGIFDPHRFKQYQDLARRFILPIGAWGAVVFVLLQAAQVVFTPISHYTVGALGGFLYGPLLGGGLNYVGRLIGHALAFLIAHKARKWAVKWVGEETMERYDHIFSGEGEGSRQFTIQHFLLFLVYFLPLFPDDEISYIVGLSKMRWLPFLLANLFGHVGGAFSLSLIGSGINTRDKWFWILSGATFAGFLAIWIVFVALRRRGRTE